MTLAMPKPVANRPERQTAIARLLFEKFEIEGVDKIAVADKMGMRPATFNAKLNGQTYLHQSRKKDVDFILQVCKIMNWDSQELMAEASKMGNEAPAQDLTVLDIFLDTIQDPNKPTEQKKVARDKVLEMFLDRN